MLVSGNTSIDFFNLLVSDKFFELVVAETNAYAPIVLGGEGKSEFSRITQWKDVTVGEIRVFFSLLICMGTISLNRMHHYWKTDRLFKLSCFSEQMSRDGFLVILVKVVLNLMREKLKSGHSLFLNNFYNSVDLFTKLLEQQIYSTRTLRLGRKNNAVEVKTVKLKKR